ncbi:hypothetical protein MMC10_007605 [Thelotrema lepadinum]|nr:hypothetical protein [Thelotrema lepadinum]
MIGIGGYTANRISGFRTAFEKFSDDDGIPYYNIIYFGSAAQAAYGSSLIALVIILALVLFASDAFTRKRSRAQAATEQTEAAGSVVATDQTLAAEDIEKGVSDV